MDNGHTLHLVARQPSQPQSSSGTSSAETTTDAGNRGKTLYYTIMSLFLYLVLDLDFGLHQVIFLVLKYSQQDKKLILGCHVVVLGKFRTVFYLGPSMLGIN